MTSKKYHPVVILLHWLTAIAVVGLFALGLWMVDLGYYDAWYKKAPDIHRSVGVLLFILVLCRILLRVLLPDPAPEANHKRWEKTSSRLVQWLLYALLLVICCSGYFISTAKGQPISVFELFSVPAVISSADNLEDMSGLVHEICAYIIIGLSALHALAALKHHFIDRDRTLLRMLGK